MCRRCGEPDKRGSAANRRARKQWLLSPESGWGGDGEKVQCWNYAECGTYLSFYTMEVDRIIPGWMCEVCGEACRDHDEARLGHPFSGGRYVRGNIEPSCGGCNQGRNEGNPWGHTSEPEQARLRRGFWLRCMTR